MATDTAVMQPPETPTVELPPAQRFVFDGLDWERYLQFDRLIGDRRFRMTFDRGYLEVMTVSLLHEKVKLLFDRLVVAISEELEIDAEGGGSTTFRREDLDRGIEPDQCYYIQNADRVANRDEVDLSIDPPPDLVIEVEISRSILDRLDVLSALGVREVWCTDGVTLRMLRRSPSGSYGEASESLCFPGLRAEDLQPFLEMRAEASSRELMSAFRSWLREFIESS